jgi:hypothetical protein
MTAAVTDHPNKAEASKRHHWGETKYLSGRDLADGHDRNERVCVACGITKITVIYRKGFPGREWRTRAGETVAFHSTPPCLPVVVASASPEEKQSEANR